MNLIPEENTTKPQLAFNLTSMVDLLFLMLIFFATLAVTRTALYDAQLDLVKLQKTSESSLLRPQEGYCQIHLNILNDGKYKWITDIHDYQMENIEKIQQEILHQYEIGILSKEKGETQILLHIDKNAPWESVARLIFSIREIGFDAHPVYTSKELQ